ncbi:hypothetical protein GCM10023216_16090 [Isoptericola chiayiensis]|uniref:Trp biosynthesis associated, transmembrane protein, Oprn/Chp n=1 Tax=Isoptericola chiayiensis TaxID=579446 RepID=A0ABP8YC31_9MICO
MSVAIRSRARAVVALLVLGAGALAAASATWLRTSVSTALEPEAAVVVTGTTAAPGVAAAAFVVVAGALATTLGGSLARRVALVVAAGGGLGITASAVAVLLDAEGPAVLGASDAAGVTELASPVQVTLLPWLAALAGALVVVVAVLALLGAGSWAATGGRHERAGTAEARPAAEPDPQADWDALSRGTDPSSDR